MIDLQELLSHYANPLEEFPKGGTPLEAAIQRQNTELLKTMLAMPLVREEFSQRNLLLPIVKHQNPSLVGFDETNSSWKKCYEC